MKRLLIVAIGGLLALPSIACAGIMSHWDCSGRILNRIKFDNYEIILKEVSEPSGETITLTNENNQEKHYTELNFLDEMLKENGDRDKDAVMALETEAVDAFIVKILKADVIKHIDEETSQTVAQEILCEITAYAVQQIESFDLNDTLVDLWASNSLDYSDIRVDIVSKAAAFDPFGVLNISGVGGTSGLVTEVFYDETENFSYNGGDQNGNGMQAELIEDVANAADGDPWVTFGFGEAVDASYGGVAGDNTSLISSGNLTGPTEKGGLNVLLNAGYEMCSFNGVPNAQNDNEVSISIVANTYANGAHVTEDGSSYWRIGSSDPWEFKLTPEPNSPMALLGILGMFLVGGVFQHFRKT